MIVVSPLQLANKAEGRHMGNCGAERCSREKIWRWAKMSQKCSVLLVVVLSLLGAAGGLEMETMKGGGCLQVTLKVRRLAAAYCCSLRLCDKI